MSMSNIFLTGKSGFIGRYFYDYFLGHPVKGREKSKIFSLSHLEIEKMSVKQLANYFLEHNIKKVIHCAALAHQLMGKKNNQKIEDLYFHANSDFPYKVAQALLLSSKNQKGSLDLEQKSDDYQMIFLSTFKVLGDHQGDVRLQDGRFTPNPQDVYARSKLHAEEELKNLFINSHISLYILRLLKQSTQR